MRGQAGYLWESWLGPRFWRHAAIVDAIAAWRLARSG
jgi:hypothetical protein